MPEACAYFRGEYVNPRDAKIGIMTHAFHYGTGTFGGINATWDEENERFCLFRMLDHYRRQLVACKMLHIHLPYSEDDMAAITAEAVRRTGFRQNVYCRPVAYKSSESLGVRLHDLDADWLVIATVLPPFASTGGLRCCVSSWTRTCDSQMPTMGKITGTYVNGALTKTEAQMDGYDDGIMLTPEGHVCEGAVTNTFLVLNGRLTTPPPSDGILLGITRDTVMQLARNELGIETVERSIARSELYRAEEAFFTGTYSGVVPIVEIDHRPVGSGEPGPLTLRLQSQYRQLALGRDSRYANWYTYVSPGSPGQPVGLVDGTMENAAAHRS